MSSPQRFCPTCDRTDHAPVCPRCDQVTGIDPMFDWTELVPGMDVTDHPFHVHTVHNMALDLQCAEPRYWWWPYVDRNYIAAEEWEGRRALRRYTRAELVAAREKDLEHRLWAVPQMSKEDVATDWRDLFSLPTFINESVAPEPLPSVAAITFGGIPVVVDENLPPGTMLMFQEPRAPLVHARAFRGRPVVFDDSLAIGDVNPRYRDEHGCKAFGMSRDTWDRLQIDIGGLSESMVRMARTTAAGTYKGVPMPMERLDVLSTPRSKTHWMEKAWRESEEDWFKRTKQKLEAMRNPSWDLPGT